MRTNGARWQSWHRSRRGEPQLSGLGGCTSAWGPSTALHGCEPHTLLVVTAQAWRAAGASVGICVQSDRFVSSVKRMAAADDARAWPVAGETPPVAVCDATNADDVESAFAELCGDGPLHAVLHGAAFAPTTAMRAPRGLIDVTAGDFAEAQLASAYSLVSVARAALPRFEATVEGSRSITTLSYLGSTRVRFTALPGACQEKLTVSCCAGGTRIRRHGACESIIGGMRATTRGRSGALLLPWLSWEVLTHARRYVSQGPEGVRVNCISAGPVRTLASRGVPGFVVSALASPLVLRIAHAPCHIPVDRQELHAAATEASPLRSPTTGEDVASMATFLASDAAAAVTGQTLFGAHPRSTDLFCRAPVSHALYHVNSG